MSSLRLNVYHIVFSVFQGVPLVSLAEQVRSKAASFSTRSPPAQCTKLSALPNPAHTGNSELPYRRSLEKVFNFAWVLSRSKGTNMALKKFPDQVRGPQSLWNDLEAVEANIHISSICMYLCMYVCTYVSMFVRTYVCTYMRVYVCTYVLCTYARMYVCMYVRMYVRMYVCVYVRMCVCAYVRMYVCTDVRMYGCTYVRMYVRMYVCMLS